MHKIIKFSLSLITIGAIFLAIATYLNKGYLPGFYENSEQKNYLVSSHEIEKLNIDLADSDITIEEGTSANIEIEYSTSSLREIKINHINKELNIKESRQRFGFNFEFFNKHSDVKIKIPPLSNIQLAVHNRVGDINLTGINIKKLFVDSNIGTLNIKNMTALDSNIKSDIGDVNIENFKGENSKLEIKVSTGYTGLNNISNFDNIQIENKTGDIKLSNSDTKDITINNKTGNIEVTSLSSELLNSVNLSTATGDIIIDKFNADSIYLNSNTGNITAHVNDSQDSFMKKDNKKTLVTNTKNGSSNIIFLK